MNDRLNPNSPDFDACDYAESLGLLDGELGPAARRLARTLLEEARKANKAMWADYKAHVCELPEAPPCDL